MPVVVVTGASQGIGAAVARAFAEAYGTEARLALVARTAGSLKKVAAACRAHGAAAEPFVCDVADEAAVARMAEAIRAAFDVPDVLVNNAGAFTPGGVREMTPADFRAQVEVNLTSAFLVTHAFLPAMVERRRGDVFFMASVASTKGYPRGVAYGAAKHGMLGLARSLREEVREHGLRVVALLPGAVYTATWAASGLPEERFIPAEDLARLVVEIHRLSARTVVEEVLLRPLLGDI
ncbi:MAG TPA: SDR family oxidoreductase [Rubricoccaceae bacterium]|nr:SDR family oxidoreductase [Rubricoccaceae bacterium]